MIHPSTLTAELEAINEGTVHIFAVLKTLIPELDGDRFTILLLSLATINDAVARIERLNRS